MKERESLKKVELFKGLPADVVDEMISRGSTRHVPAGKALAQQGHADAGLQLLLEGSATVSVNGVEVATLSEGDYFGEMSLFDGAPRSATVISGPEGARTFAISPALFAELLDSYPHISRVLLRTLTTRIRRLEADRT